MPGSPILLDKSALQSFSGPEVEALGKLTSVLVPHVLLAELRSDLAKKSNEGGPKFVASQVRKLLRAQPFHIESFPTTLAREFLRRENVMGTAMQQPGETLIYSHLMLEELASTESASLENANLAIMLRGETRPDFKTWARPYLENRVLIKKCHSIEAALSACDNALLNPMVADACLSSFLLRDGSLMYRQALESRRSVRFGWWNDLPYLFHCVRSELLSAICWRDTLIGQGPGNALDIQYLFYLPVSSIFSSGDQALLKLAKALKPSDQLIVSANDLKKDLKELLPNSRGTATLEILAEQFPSSAFFQHLAAQEQSKVLTT